ncbi:MAG: LytR/AlgR family response regulator transcription factor [Acidobacteriota bacterium]
MKFRVLLVDDEPLARRRLRRLLEDHQDLEVVAEASSGDEVVSAVLQHRPELLFLDVRMPGKDGLQALRTLQAKLPAAVRPLAVLTTAYEDHAVEAFELEATDYLVKPIERQDLDRALRRVRRILWRRHAMGSATEPGAAHESEDPAPPPPAEALSAAAARSWASGHLAAHRAGKIVRLEIDEIACLIVEETITWAHTPAGRFRLRQGLAALEKRLACPPFFRVSRSAIVNLAWIDQLAPMFSGTYRAFLKAPVEMEIHVSRRRARALRRLLGW